MKNWKSLLAFLVFIGCYVYTIYTPATNEAISTAGTIALISSLFMMFRSELTNEVINRLVDSVGEYIREKNDGNK